VPRDTKKQGRSLEFSSNGPKHSRIFFTKTWRKITAIARGSRYLTIFFHHICGKISRSPWSCLG